MCNGQGMGQPNGLSQGSYGMPRMSNTFSTDPGITLRRPQMMEMAPRRPQASAPFSAQPFTPQAAPAPKPFSVNMNDPYARLREAAEGVKDDPMPSQGQGIALMERPKPQSAPQSFQPVPGGANTPPPSQMQPGQVRWDWNRPFGGGDSQWSPVFHPNVWSWANMVSNPGGQAAPWAPQIDQGNFMQSLGQLSGNPYDPGRWGSY